MNKKTRMGLMLAVLAVLLAGYGIVGQMGFEETASVTETAGAFPLGEWTSDTLAGLTWENDYGAFAFALEDGVWTAAGEAAFPVNQDALTALADKVIAMTATREITDVSDPADYGLDAPVFTLTLTDAAGENTTWAMGDETPFGDGYYVSVSGRSAIYTLSASLSSTFHKTLTQLCQMEEIPDVDSVTQLTVSGGIDAVYDEADGVWLDSVTGTALDTAKVEALADDAKGLVWSAVADGQADDAALTGYGLDEAQATVITAVGGEDATLCVWLGRDNGSGDRYARLPGSRLVYTVDGDDVEALLDAGVDTLWDTVPVKRTYEDVASASFAWDGGSLTIERAAQAEDGDETGTQDGEDANDALWTLLCGLAGTARVEAEAQGEPLLTVDYTAADGAQKALAIYAYDVEHYLVPMTSGHAMLVPAAEVDTILRTLKTMH